VTTSPGARAAVVWVFAVLCSAALRYAIVKVYAVWTPDGRLAVSPGWFTAVNTAQLAAAGALFLLLIYPRNHGS
jgi:hypothetical protein